MSTVPETVAREFATERFVGVKSCLLLLSIGLLGVYVGAQLHSFALSHLALWDAKGAQLSLAASTNAGVREPNIDFSLWDKARIKAYHASLALKLQQPIAVLSIPRLHLTVPVFDGTDDTTLNRGAGRISGTVAPGSQGNLGIAGHRDGFFRGLKYVQLGDTVEVETAAERDTYVIDGIRIVDPTDVGVLRAQPKPTVTLVTCYPFHFIGNAPQRFIVRASLRERDLIQRMHAGKPTTN